MFAKITGESSGDGRSSPTTGGSSDASPAEEPVTLTFLAQLFSTLRDDFQELRKDLQGEIKEVQRDIDAVGERVASIEEHQQARDEEVEHLQQEILRLQEQQIDLQSHTEDLENRSRRNNIRVRGVPSKMEGRTLLDSSRSSFAMCYRRHKIFLYKLIEPIGWAYLVKLLHHHQTSWPSCRIISSKNSSYNAQEPCSL